MTTRSYGGQGFCDDSNKTRNDGGEGVKNCPKLRDVIYERTLNRDFEKNPSQSVLEEKSF